MGLVSKSLGTDCLTLLDLVPEVRGVGEGGEPILGCKQNLFANQGSLT